MSIVLCQLKAWDGSQEVSLYIGSDYYFDGTNEYIDRLMEPLVIRRSMGGAFTGAGEASVGSITVSNHDNEITDWFDYSWGGRDVTILQGDPDDDIGSFTTLFKGVAERIEMEDNVITLFTKDLFDKLNRPVVENSLNMHPQALMNPWPVGFGGCKNVTPDPIRDFSVSLDGRYVVGAWSTNLSSGLPVSAVYENGKETTKSLDKRVLMGGGEGVFIFDVNDPEGTVTCDLLGMLDGATSGSVVRKPGEILKRALTYDIKRLGGFARGGSTTTAQLEESASDEDDFYNGTGSPGANNPGTIWIIDREDSNNVEREMISDYDGATRTATFASAISFAVEEGFRYEIALDTAKQYGPLTDDDLDTASFTALDTDAPYNLGIWITGSGMTFLDLLDQILPAGFVYYWNRSSKLTVGLLSAPSGTPVKTIDNDDTFGKIRQTKEETPIYRVKIGYDRNWTVMASPDPTVDIQRASFLAREYIWELAEDNDTKTTFPNSKPEEYVSFLTDRDDAKTEAARILELFGTERRRMLLETFEATSDLDLNDVVTVKDDDHNLENGLDLVVVGITEYPLKGKADLELWG